MHHKILDIAPAISEGLSENYRLLAGMDVTLPCSVTGVPKPTISWYKDGRIIGSPFVDKLVLQKVSVKDSGHYKCVAVNIGGDASSVGTVDVHCKSLLLSLCTHPVFGCIPVYFKNIGGQL